MNLPQIFVEQMKEILDAAQAVYNNPSLNQEDIDQAVASFDGVQLVQRGNVEKLETEVYRLKSQYFQDPCRGI